MSERPKVQPWSAKLVAIRTQILISAVLPAALAALVMLLTGLDFSVVLLSVFLPVQLLAAGYVGFKNFGRRGIKDAAMMVFVYFFSALVLVLLMSVLISVIFQGAAAISPHFFYENNKYVSNTTTLEYGGVGHAILGTLIIVLLTTLVAVPLGIAMAVYLTQSQAKHLGLVRTVTQALSGLPSVVSGLFILSFMSIVGLERSGFTGALALFPLMLPTVARVAEESLRLVPADLRLAALALGAPNYRAFFQVILPAAKSGIITALLLGLARVVGETAPLILTTNANNTTNLNPFSGGIASLPTFVYSFLGSGYTTSQQRAWGGALVLLMLVGILFVAARVLGRTKSTKSKGSK
ncbi:MAG: phosphate transporter permease PstA [Actinomycetota bacterium]|jgi:phosphate transport system permease protein